MKTEYNTKLDQNMESFIQLRIEGKSYDKIAKELNVSKQTLIEWNKNEMVKKNVKEGKSFKLKTLIETHNYDLAKRMQTYLELSERINDELLNRDFTEINTESLLKMSIANDNRLNEITKYLDLGSKAEKETEKETEIDMTPKVLSIHELAELLQK